MTRRAAKSTKKNKLLIQRKYSLYYGLVSALIIGMLFAVVSFFATTLISTSIINEYYITDEKRNEREAEYLASLQSFIDERGLSSEDTGDLASWTWEKRYVYVLLYKDGQLFFSAGMSDESAEYPFLADIGQYPDIDEIVNEALGRGMRELKMADGTHTALIAEFTEYLYYDLSNILGIFMAISVFAAFIANYLTRIIKRIKRLESDVAIVSSGEMEHPIHYNDDDDDEISTLSRNVENMRGSMLYNIQKEREARDANNALITSISHDIRTPLTILLGYIDMMKNHGSADDELRSYVDASENTAMRLKQLSEDMFKYSLAFGDVNIALKREEYDAKTLLEQMLSEHILLLREKGYTLVENLDGAIEESLTIYTDAPNLMRIIDNVFSNLTKYADIEQPIELSATLAGDILTLECKNRIRSGGPEVESNGIGLKTCKRLAALVAEGFEYTSVGDVFTTVLTLKLTRPRAAKKHKDKTNDQL